MVINYEKKRQEKVRDIIIGKILVYSSEMNMTFEEVSNRLNMPVLSVKALLDRYLEEEKAIEAREKERIYRYKHAAEIAEACTLAFEATYIKGNILSQIRIMQNLSMSAEQISQELYLSLSDLENILTQDKVLDNRELLNRCKKALTPEQIHELYTLAQNTYIEHYKKYCSIADLYIYENYAERLGKISEKYGQYI